MSSDDHARNTHYSSNRKPGQAKSHGYSPSTNYNYGNTNSHGNNSHGSHGNTGGGNKSFHRKPSGPFKRDGHGGSSDKLIKQNDIIIHLLKEIRDRLPEPPNVPVHLDEPEVLGTDEVMDSEGSQISCTFESDTDDTDDLQGDVGITEEDKIVENTGVLETNPVQYDLSDDDLDNKVNGNI